MTLICHLETPNLHAFACVKSEVKEHVSRLQRDQEFSNPGFPGQDFAKSQDPGIFRDGISLKFLSRDFTKSMRSPGITFSAHKFGHFGGLICL